MPAPALAQSVFLRVRGPLDLNRGFFQCLDDRYPGLHEITGLNPGIFVAATAVLNIMRAVVRPTEP